MRAMSVLAILLVTQAGGGTAQEARLLSRLDSATTASVMRLVDSAARLDLPTEPLIQKAFEGKAKGATSAKIVVAVGRLLDGLIDARRGLGKKATPDELLAGALWVRAGGAVELLSRLRRADTSRALAIPITVSADLVARGWSAVEAVEALESMFAAKVSDASLLTMRTEVESAVKRGADLLPTVRQKVAKLIAGKKKLS